MNKIKENLSLIIVSVATIIYLLFIFKATELREFVELELNAKGDFLAGVFAPLAFLWLVFGYYQQGQELKQNTKALKLQSQELSNLVKQQEKQNEIYESEMNDKRTASKPLLSYKSATYEYTIYDTQDGEHFEGTVFSFILANFGSIAKNIKINGQGIARTYYKLETDTQINVFISFPDERDKELSKFQGKKLSIELSVCYCDNNGYEYYEEIKLETDSFIAGAVNVNLPMEISRYS